MRVASVIFTALASGAVLAHAIDAQEVNGVAEWPSSAVGGYTMAVLGDSGRVFIAGTSTGRTSVQVHDLATGTYLGQVGREGAGPGEFRQITGIAFRDSRLAVADARNYRITVYDRDLEVESMFPIRVQPVGSGLGATTDGFVLLGLLPGCQPNCRPRLWLVREDGSAEPIVSDPGFRRGAIDHHYVNVGDSLLALRHSYLGVWMIGRDAESRTVAHDSTFSVQTRDFPDYFTPENGPVGGWVAKDRVVLVHDRYPASQEFSSPSTTGGPPARVEDQRFSVLRVVDASTGEGLREQELPMRVRGVLGPGLLWGVELDGLQYHFKVWRVKEASDDGGRL